MKTIQSNLILLFCLAFFVVFLSGCPVELDYPPGEPGSEKINKNLIGTWSNTKDDAEMGKITIEKKDESSYRVKVHTKGSMYSVESDDFTA